VPRTVVVVDKTDLERAVAALQDAILDGLLRLLRRLFETGLATFVEGTT
jgi:hypothetical protein